MAKFNFQADDGVVQVLALQKCQTCFCQQSTELLLLHLVVLSQKHVPLQSHGPLLVELYWIIKVGLIKRDFFWLLGKASESTSRHCWPSVDRIQATIHIKTSSQAPNLYTSPKLRSTEPTHPVSDMGRANKKTWQGKNINLMTKVFSSTWAGKQTWYLSNILHKHIL